MMIMNAILAVALGLAPEQAAQVSSAEYNGLIGRYSQVTDERGTLHLKGFDTRNGRPFNLQVTNGHVQGLVGDIYVTFDYVAA